MQVLGHVAGLKKKMDSKLEEILRKSTFRVEAGRFAYAKVRSVPAEGNHFMIARDNSEITVVTGEENLRHLDLIERNKDTYALIMLNAYLPFYSTGFIAAVSDAVASTNNNVLVVSTYSRDYILVDINAVDAARSALAALGLTEVVRRE